MIERPLMTANELKSMPKGSFIVMKTGHHPMRVQLRLFKDWGIEFGKPYSVPERAQRAVAYADRRELEAAIEARSIKLGAAQQEVEDAEWQITQIRT